MDATRWITPYRDKVPAIDPTAFVDVSARIIGDVVLNPESSVWPMAVLRADAETISVGKRSAVLDLALLEAPEKYPVAVEDGSIISHGAMIHGAVVRTGALVGIGAIVLDGAEVSGGCIIGAGSVVAPGKRIPPNSLVLGVPGKVMRETTEAERANIRAQVDELYEKSRHLMANRD